MKILLIDDNKEFTWILKNGLEGKNYTVDVAYDGIVGEKMAMGKKYDIIILDIILPGINGFELCKEIRNRINTPVLIMTSLNMIGERARGFRVGADDYLVKPFSIKELISRIESLTLQSKKLKN